ncbi:PTS transporter subunit EIIC [Collinsella sp. AGMB00827]|uniref:PTS transporter subunit EIIC n=1 Tax=Collinsella ureilytica TaxID=2869515 RepID=A0ABS7MIU2_9ACTN|nr:PTS transporter subunit EIIC [Collinsella urealyticum]MBY4797167.1 PTS transporter subunit EIIC [Collinsella urealyticum]
MAKDYNALACEILKNVGGDGNVAKLFHCATRLRFTLNDSKQVDFEQLKKNPHILGVVEDAAGIQLVIGNDVTQVYQPLLDQYPHFAGHENAKQQSESYSGNPISRLLNMLSAIVGPVIPLIMCSGLISALLVILTRWGGLDAEGSTYALLNMVGTGALYFLPLLIAYTSSKRFGCDPMMSLFLGALLVAPTLIDLAGKGEFVDLFGLPVKTGGYASSLIPAIITIWVLSHIERLVARIVPEAVRFVFRPLVSLMIMVPITLCVTAPLGGYAGTLLMDAIAAINAVAPWASVLIVGCLTPALVLTGMHLAIIPLVMMLFSTVDYDNMLFPAFIGMNFSQFGVAILISMSLPRQIVCTAT